MNEGTEIHGQAASGLPSNDIGSLSRLLDMPVDIFCEVRITIIVQIMHTTHAATNGKDKQTLGAFRCAQSCPLNSAVK
jgi:hypothetical protein